MMRMEAKRLLSEVNRYQLASGIGWRKSRRIDCAVRMFWCCLFGLGGNVQ